MGKYKAIIPIALALVIAASGSMFLYKWLERQSTLTEVVKTETEAVPVAVAAVNLPWGTKLKRDMLRTVPFTRESIPEGYSSKLDRLEGRVLISPLKKNEPVTEFKLAPDSVTTGGVSAIVKPGKRAIAVKGDKVIGLSGLIVPGNRVDVLVTLTHPKTKMEVTKIVLENILVLATGTEIQKNGKGDPAPVDVYTLEVTPEEGEKLALAATEGRLHFALRNVTDAETVLTNGATIPQTLESFSGAHPKPGASAKTRKWRPRRATVTVEIIKGAKVSKKKFKL
jgi:pilus assembly protein CpaB